MSSAQQCSVLFVIRYFHPFIGGLENNTLTLAAALRKRQNNIMVVTGRFHKSWSARETIRGVPTVRLPSPRIKIAGPLVFLLALSCYLIKNRARYDMLHVFQIGYTAALTILIGRLLRKQTVLTLASSGSGGDIQRHGKTPWGRLFISLCRRASRIVILNKHMLKELKSIAYHEKNSVYIPNGVDTALFHPWRHEVPPPEKTGTRAEKVILYTGRLSREKGLDFLIRSFAKTHAAMPLRLLILGDGKEKKPLQELIRQCCVEGRVQLMPAVENVVPFLQSADVFVLPSRFEGLSNSLLEAMACGVPVIATRVTGNLEVVEDGVNGMLVEYNNTEALAQAIAVLTTDHEYARELAGNALAKVHACYSLEDSVAKYAALYKSLRL
jgi:glycosyltransferase involved in cell wall biosynthesis